MKKVLFLLVSLFLMVAAAQAADYATVAEAVTAVEGLPADATGTFLAGATLGVGAITIGLVVRMLRRGIGLK